LSAPACAMRWAPLAVALGALGLHSTGRGGCGAPIRLRSVSRPAVSRSCTRWDSIEIIGFTPDAVPARFPPGTNRYFCPCRAPASDSDARVRLGECTLHRDPVTEGGELLGMRRSGVRIPSAPPNSQVRATPAVLT
jgi:hypothetical protein